MPPMPPFDPFHSRSNWRTQSSGVPMQASPVEAKLHVGARLLARLRHVGEGDDAPLAPVGRLAVRARRFLVDAPVAGVRIERLVRGAADREHADAVLAGSERAGRRAR